MDFNTIYESISTYVGTGTIAMGIVTFLAVVLKAFGVIKEIKSSFSNTESEALKLFKQAIPKELYVSLESITKAELSKIITKIEKVVNDTFLSQIKANTELTQAIASALITMKAIPDSCKKDIAKLLEIKEVETTESLKVELLSIEEKNQESEQTEKILID